MFKSQQPIDLVFEEGGRIEYIDDGAFQHANISSLVLPDAVKRIVDSAASKSIVAVLILPHTANGI